MVNNDTIELLKQCNVGIKMGVETIDNVMDKVNSSELSSLLSDSKNEHQRLGSETHSELNNYDKSGTEPSPIAKAMTWMKSNIMITADDDDKTIASFVTDGCNVGIKTLNKYLNQYKEADERSKDIAKKLIKMEDTLVMNLREYL